MGINGDNNRVAGRDYYELNAVLKLTPEQLRQVSIKPCARCEDRIVSSDATICNQCRSELETKAENERLQRYGVLILFVWGLLTTWLNAHPPGVSPQVFFALGAASVMIVVIGAVVWHGLRRSFNGS